MRHDSSSIVKDAKQLRAGGSMLRTAQGALCIRHDKWSESS